VTGSEFAFLAMGLILGAAGGVMLIRMIRARGSGGREVRVTMAADAVPRRRAMTLAGESVPDPTAQVGAIGGGPVDPGGPGTAAVPAPMDHRTAVLDPLPGRIDEPAFRLSDPTPRQAPQAVPVAGGADPMLAALRASAAASAVAAMRQTAMATTSLAASAGGAEDTDGGSAGGAPVAVSTRDRPAGSPSTTDDGPCADARRLAGERCALADRATEQARGAEDAHRAAQRAYDEHEAATAMATTGSDARAIRHAKDEAQERFRAGRAAANTTEAVEAAARIWLLEINEINAAAREALGTLARERAATQSLALALERTGLEADAARIAAETAKAACMAAREAAAECEEREAGGVAGHFPAMPSQGDSDDEDDPADGREVALGSGGSPRIFRLLRGDRSATQEMVAALGGDDADERRRWQEAISDLVDAIIGDALAATALEFPVDHDFWGPFTREQARDIATALSSLGYRFDGRGGWVDARTPSQRDLSLALGYAGLDPMRMRHWPDEDAMSRLFEDVRVSAAEHLASAAGDLTLGELVTMLGRRADGMADVWNDWGRIRPLLLEES
jgi:hypothetical protein